MSEISAIIPAHNCAATVARAIESVLAQSFADFELIVVDDGSVDATGEVIAGFSDPRVKILRHAANLGAAAARNTGIMAARGRYIAFLDSDDLWLPEKLQIQISAMREQGAEIAVSCTGVIMHLLDHGFSREQALEDSEDWFLRLALGCDVSPGTTLVATRETFERIGLLDVRLPRFEDWDWLLRYAQIGRILAIREPLAHVYNRRGRLGDQYERSTKVFLAKHQALYSALGREIRCQAACQTWLQVSGTYAFEGRYLDAMRTALYGAAYQPVTCLRALGRYCYSRTIQRLRGHLPVVTSI